MTDKVVERLRSAWAVGWSQYLTPDDVRTLVEYVTALETELTEVKARLEARTGET